MITIFSDSVLGNGTSIVHRFSLHTRWLKSVADLVALRTGTIVAGGGHRAPLAGMSCFFLSPYLSLHHGTFSCSQSVRNSSSWWRWKREKEIIIYSGKSGLSRLKLSGRRTMSSKVHFCLHFFLASLLR